MKKGSIDPGFESYRRERQRRKLNDGKPGTQQQEQRYALRELEEVEKKEERSRALSRDVQDFFESATRMAASIVRRVAETARVEVDTKLNTQMEEFLSDALHRLEEVVVNFVGRNHGPEALEDIEPKMHNLVGQMLDDFRKMGTAGATLHLGEDPTQKDLATVRKEFQEKSPPRRATDTSIVPVHGVADAGKGRGKQTGPALDEHIVAEVAQAQEKAATAATKPRKPKEKLPPELESFKEELKAEVRAGKLSRDQAKAAWEDRVRGK